VQARKASVPDPAEGGSFLRQARVDKAKEEGRQSPAPANGADFAELAEPASGDESANRGGDMVICTGHAAGSAGQGGQASSWADQEPMVTLTAVTKSAARRRVPPSCACRCQMCRRPASRERGDQAWQDLIAKLRKTTPFTIQALRGACCPAMPASGAGCIFRYQRTANAVDFPARSGAAGTSGRAAERLRRWQGARIARCGIRSRAGAGGCRQVDTGRASSEGACAWRSNRNRSEFPRQSPWRVR
jgi:hypothetical protein